MKLDSGVSIEETAKEGRYREEKVLQAVHPIGVRFDKQEILVATKYALLKRTQVVNVKFDSVLTDKFR